MKFIDIACSVSAMKTRKRKPFSIYPKAADMATATQIAEEEDLHVYQVFIRAFRQYARRRQLKQSRQPALSHR